MAEIVNTSKCTIITDLSRNDVLDFVRKAADTPFTFRNKLNFSTLYSFGNEIEFNCDKNFEELFDFVKRFNEAYSLYEDDRYEFHNEPTASGEIVTPILNNNIYNWRIFELMYKAIKKMRSGVADNTSSHVHVGTHMINTPHELAMLIKTLLVFEPIIFKFGYGYSSVPRTFIRATMHSNNYAMVMFPEKVRCFMTWLDRFDLKNCEQLVASFDNFGTVKESYRSAFNFNCFAFEKLFDGYHSNEPDPYDEIEFRCFNGTLRPEIAQNNINLIVNILRAVHENDIDEEYVNREYKKKAAKSYKFVHFDSVFEDIQEVRRYNSLLRSFNKIDLEKATKLADMIFKDDLDKLLFLKQYLKLFREDKKEEVIATL